MDIDKYLNDFREQLENDLQSISDSIYNDNPFLRDLSSQSPGHGEEKPDLALEVYDAMEPECKAKLGTFERMVNGTQEFVVKGVGYDTDDYAPLVNLLSGIMEVELSLSVWQLIRSKHGIKMPEYFNHKSHTGKILRKGEFEVKLDSNSVMLGPLCVCCELEGKALAGSVEGFEELVRLLNKLKEFRNDASHGVFIGQQRFNSFFPKYKLFHTNMLPNILNLKQRMSTDGRHKDCSGVTADDNMEMESKALPADEYIARLNTMFDDLVGSAAVDESRQLQLTEMVGIMLTDTGRLAEKYDCGVEKVKNVLETFISQSRDYNMYWQLLDVAGKAYSGSDWNFYNRQVTQFIGQKKMKPGKHLHLYIIGGDDVVPLRMIQVKQKGRPDDSTNIPTDLSYAFDGDYIGDFMTGKQKGLNIADVRNTVARMPLQNGPLTQYDIEKDLGMYFNRCLKYVHGVAAKNVLMTTNRDWAENSGKVVEKLPLQTSTDDPSITYKNMYVSPKLDIRDAEAMKSYKKSLADADLLLFNLHGSERQGMPYFFGGSGDSLAFSPAQLNETSSKVLITMACYGARYTDYSREDSMLMSALYNSDFMMYVGSLVSVPMFGSYPNSDSMIAHHLMFSTYNGSEVLTRFMVLYMYTGLSFGSGMYSGTPFGTAYIQAALSYFNMFRHIESDDFALSTILMFAAYGNPMLCLQPRLNLVDIVGGLNKEADAECVRVAYCKPETKVVYDKKNVRQASLLNKLRGIVDSNFESIHKMVEENLYNVLGLPPRQLETVERFTYRNSDDTKSSGYYYHYNNPDTVFCSDTVVEVSMDGKPVRVYTSKKP